MANPPLLAFVAARSGMGKTTFLTKVISLLTARGYRVAALKHIKEAQLDPAGKDSWYFRQAGATAVGLVGPVETIVITCGGNASRPETLLDLLPPVDVVLLEGFREASVPKIEIVRAALGRAPITPVKELIAVVTDLPDLDPGVPCFPLDDAGPLVDWLGQKFLPRPPVLATGEVNMIDITAKPVTRRVARAKGEIRMAPQTLAGILTSRIEKGDVFAVARVAAIMAAKETWRLIPLCHPLPIGAVKITLTPDLREGKIEIEAWVTVTDRTGAEMEALTAVSVAALTVYDMCKAVDQKMEIGRIRLVEKEGGRSGHFIAEEEGE